MIRYGYKKKSNYLCKAKVEYLSCGSTVMSENQKLHIKNRHGGDLSIKFKIINDAKQPRLDIFTLSKKDTSSNIPSISSTIIDQREQNKIDEAVEASIYCNK